MPNAMPFSDVAALLRSAKSRRELMRAAQSIQHVAQLGDRERLGKIFKQRYDQLK
jgi:hypothetical protein